MANNKTNIYDLVGEVNKSKSKSAMQKEKELNDIYSMLDDIKNDNDISIDDVREKVNNYSKEKEPIKDYLQNYSNVVVKPEVPEYVTNYDLYSECIISFIQSVDYGTNNSKEYVKGHKAALEKYYSEVKNNRKDIYVVEAHINEEISNASSKDSIYEKGYYDGLFYVLRSLKKAKQLLTKELTNKLKEKIK